MSFPTTASFVPSGIEVPPPPLSSSFLSILLCFRLPPSFDAPRQNFSTRDISRYEWGATGTIFPSSCYPVSFFAVARPRDLSFAAARFQPALSASFSPSHSPSRRRRRRRRRQLRCNGTVAASAQLRHPRNLSSIGAFEVDVSSGHIFVTRVRANLLREAARVNLREYPRSLVESSFLLQFKPNLGLFRRDLNYPRYYTAACFGRCISIRRVDNTFRVRSVALIINYLLIP